MAFNATQKQFCQLFPELVEKYREESAGAAGAGGAPATTAEAGADASIAHRRKGAKAEPAGAAIAAPGAATSRADSAAQGKGNEWTLLIVGAILICAVVAVLLFRSS